MLEKLQAVEDKYRELESMIADPDILQDMDRWQRCSKEHAELAPIVEKFREYKKVTKDIEEDKALFDEPLDDEMRHLAEQEIAALTERQQALREEFPVIHPHRTGVVHLRPAAAQGDGLV